MVRVILLHFDAFFDGLLTHCAPPPHSGNAWKKTFFSREVFPYAQCRILGFCKIKFLITLGPVSRCCWESANWCSSAAILAIWNHPQHLRPSWLSAACHSSLGRSGCALPSLPEAPTPSPLSVNLQQNIAFCTTIALIIPNVILKWCSCRGKGFIIFLSDPGIPGLIYGSGCHFLSFSERLLKLNWCDSGWWRYQVNTNW